MGAGGSIKNMIDSYRDNMRMLRKTRLFKKGNTIFEKEVSATHTGNQKLVYKKADRAWLEKFHEKLRREKKAEVTRLVIVMLIMFSIAGFLVVRFSGFSFDRAGRTLREKQEAAYRDQKARYDYYIVLGDEWLYQKKWHNAISDYKISLGIIPDAFEARIKLARAYAWSCRETNYYCEEAVNLLEELNRQFPKSLDVYELMAEYYAGTGNDGKLKEIYDKIDSLRNKP
jgi:predicted Zn-dependent protease